MGVSVDRIGIVGRVAVGRRAGRAGTFTTGPPVISPGLTPIYLLPGVLADVVDKELVRPGLEGEAEGVAQPRGEDLLALSPGAGPAGGITRHASRCVRVAA